MRVGPASCRQCTALLKRHGQSACYWRTARHRDLRRTCSLAAAPAQRRLRRAIQVRGRAVSAVSQSGANSFFWWRDAPGSRLQRTALLGTRGGWSRSAAARVRRTPAAAAGGQDVQTRLWPRPRGPPQLPPQPSRLHARHESVHGRLSQARRTQRRGVGCQVLSGGHRRPPVAHQHTLPVLCMSLTQTRECLHSICATLRRSGRGKTAPEALRAGLSHVPRHALAGAQRSIRN